MKLLIMSNAHLDCNTGIHILSVATELVKLGATCSVVVPTKEDVVRSGLHDSIVVTDVNSLYSEYDRYFPDLIWLWTPRELNRKNFELLQSRRRLPYAIHLEDNEHHITRSAFGLSATAFRRWAQGGPGPVEVPGHLSHPARVRELIAGAAGITGLVEEVMQIVETRNTETLVFWPGYDETLPWGMEADPSLREHYGVKPGHHVLAYTGNLHPANVDEVRSLYLAVALLNRRGLPVTLLRTGEDYAPLTDHGEDLLKKNVIELGLVARSELPRILSIADVLVQPGIADDFNIYRFPSKVPEFLASRKPVILPRCNLGSYLQDGHDAIVLPRCGAHEIAMALESLLPDIKRRLAIGNSGAVFASQYLRWGVAASRILPYLNRLLVS